MPMVYDLPEVGPGSIPGSIPEVRVQGPDPGIAAGIEVAGNAAARTMERQSEAMQRMAQIAGQIQNDIDDASAKAADNALEETIRQVNYDPEKGYFALEGKAALDARRDAQESIRKRVEELGGTMQNPLQRTMFQNAAVQRMNSAFLQMDTHAMQQAKAWAKQEAALRKKAATGGARRAAGAAVEDADSDPSTWVEKAGPGQTDDSADWAEPSAPTSRRGASSNPTPDGYAGDQGISVQFADEFSKPPGNWFTNKLGEYTQQFNAMLGEVTAEAKAEGVPDVGDPHAAAEKPLPPEPDSFVRRVKTAISDLVEGVTNDLVSQGKPIEAARYLNANVGKMLDSTTTRLKTGVKQAVINRRGDSIARELMFQMLGPDPDPTRQITGEDVRKMVESKPVLQSNTAYRMASVKALDARVKDWNEDVAVKQKEALGNAWQQALAGASIEEIAASPAWPRLGGTLQADFADKFRSVAEAGMQREGLAETLHLIESGEVMNMKTGQILARRDDLGEHNVNMLLKARADGTQTTADQIKALKDKDELVFLQHAVEYRAYNDPKELVRVPEDEAKKVFPQLFGDTHGGELLKRYYELKQKGEAAVIDLTEKDKTLDAAAVINGYMPASEKAANPMQLARNEKFKADVRLHLRAKFIATGKEPTNDDLRDAIDTVLKRDVIRTPGYLSNTDVPAFTVEDGSLKGKMIQINNQWTTIPEDLSPELIPAIKRGLVSKGKDPSMVNVIETWERMKANRAGKKVQQ